MMTSLSLSEARIDIGFKNVSNAYVHFDLDTPQETKLELETQEKLVLFSLGLQALPKANYLVFSTHPYTKSFNYILSFQHQRAPPFYA